MNGSVLGEVVNRADHLCPSHLVSGSFRDTIGAHSDYDASITSLPSHAEFESLFIFAREFYEVVSRSINEMGPAVIPGTVGHGLIQLMKSVGVRDPRFDFEDEK
jgi:hypothetical protein